MPSSTSEANVETHGMSPVSAAIKKPLSAADHLDLRCSFGPINTSTPGRQDTLQITLAVRQRWSLPLNRAWKTVDYLTPSAVTSTAQQLLRSTNCSFISSWSRPGVVAHACEASTREAERQGSFGSEASLNYPISKKSSRYFSGWRANNVCKSPEPV